MTILRLDDLRLGSKRGQALVEVGLMIPWLAITFLAVIDFGSCAYGLIATESAARSGAAYAAASSNNSSATAAYLCTNYILPTLQSAPGMSGVTGCTGTSPVTVTPTSGTVGSLTTVTVSVKYTVPLIGISGISPTSLAITRSVTLPVR